MSLAPITLGQPPCWPAAGSRSFRRRVARRAGAASTGRQPRNEAPRGLESGRGVRLLHEADGEISCQFRLVRQDTAGTLEGSHSVPHCWFSFARDRPTIPVLEGIQIS